MNNITILGTITKDIELKETESGVKYTRFSIAVNRKFKNENGDYDTDFFNIVAWRGTAEFINNYFDKGKRIAISGRLQTNKYTDKDGNERIGTEIVANDVQIIEKKSSEGNSTPKAQTTENKAENSVSDEDVYAEFGQQLEIDDEDISF